MEKQQHETRTNDRHTNDNKMAKINKIAENFGDGAT